MLYAPRILTAALPLLMTASIAFGQQAEKIVIKSFNTNGQQALNFDLPGSAEIKAWDQPTIRVQITIQLASGNNGMLDELIKVGRYNLSAEVTPEQFRVIAPNAGRKITVKGQELKDSISYVVFVPKNSLVRLNGQEIIGYETAAATKH